MFALGWFMRKTVLSKLERGTQILCSMGAQLIVFNAIILIFSAYPRDLAIIETRIDLAPKVSIGLIQLACFIMSGIVLIRFHLFLKYTWTGKAIKAVVQKKDIANLMGIKSERMLDLAFSLSYVMIGLAGIMLMLMFQVEPNFGNYLQLIAFIVCITAGLGNRTGAYLMGMIVGVFSALINGVIGSQFHDPLLFSIFIVILLLRPNGVFTSKAHVARKI
jgi:branched-chain amino acid transport system permease protein